MSRPAALPAWDLVLVLLVTVLWGGNIVAIKLATSAIPPFLSTGLRFACVALVVCPFYRPAPGMLRHILPVALVMGVGHFGLLFLGLSGVDAATGSIVTQLGVPFSVILAWLVLHDRIDLRRITGLILAFSGVVVLAGSPDHVNLVSVAIVVLSDLMWAIAMLLIKRAPPIPPMVFTGWFAFLAAPILLTISAVLEHSAWPNLPAAPVSAWAGLAYTVIGSSLIAHTLWYVLLRRHPLSQVAPFTLLAPLVAFSIGALYLNDSINLVKVLGGILTILGVAIIEIRGPLPVNNVDEQT